MTKAEETGQSTADRTKEMSAQLIHKGIRPTTAQAAASARSGRLGRAWHRVHLALADMNYGARRAVEVQAPWIVDEQWHSR
jgi:hypothetical protein